MYSSIAWNNHSLSIQIIEGRKTKELLFILLKQLECYMARKQKESLFFFYFSLDYGFECFGEQ